MLKITPYSAILQIELDKHLVNTNYLDKLSVLLQTGVVFRLNTGREIELSADAVCFDVSNTDSTVILDIDFLNLILPSEIQLVDFTNAKIVKNVSNFKIKSCRLINNDTDAILELF